MDSRLLRLLARAGDHGLDEAVEIEVLRCDPLLRPFLRRRAKRAVEAARETTRHTAMEHILRLAYVREHPRAAVADPDNVTEVAETFEALQRGGPLSQPSAAARPYRDIAEAVPALTGSSVARLTQKKERWWLTWSLLLGALSFGAGALLWATRPVDMRNEEQKFADSAPGQALSRRFEVRAATSTATALDKPPLSTSDPKVRAAMGQATVARIEQLANDRELVRASQSTAADEAGGPLFRGVNDINRAFAEARFPALVHGYLQGEPGLWNVWITSYFVASRHLVEFAGQTQKVAWVHRLDRMNLVDPRIRKFVSEEWTIVSLDRIEEDIAETIIPPVGHVGPLRWPVPSTTPSADESAIAERGSRLVRAELATMGLTASVLKELSDYLQQRSTLAARAGLSGLGTRDRIRLGGPVRSHLMTDPRTTPVPQDAIDEILERASAIQKHDAAISQVVTELAALEEEIWMGSHTSDEPVDRGWTRGHLAPLTRARKSPRWASYRLLCLARDEGKSSTARYAAHRAVMLLGEALGVPKDAPFSVVAGAILDASEERLRLAAGNAYQASFSWNPELVPKYTRTPL